jgi:hypothetical protein
LEPALVDKRADSHPGTIDNGVDWGAFAACCKGRGGGSHGCFPNQFPFSCKPPGKIKADSG